MIRFKAHFDGEKLCPDEPVSLPLGVPLEVTAAEVSDCKEPVTSRSPAELFAHIESKVGLHEHPVDWSVEHDHYLHGAPKRNENPTE